MKKGNGLWNGLVNNLGNWWGKEKTIFFFFNFYLEWLGNGEGYGLGND